MKYTKYATFNCQGLNDKNKQKSLAADFIHHSITVMMLQETRIIGQGVHEIKPSDGENFLLYNSGHPNRSYGGTAFLLAKETVTRSKVSFQPISERISTLKMIANKKKYCFISVYAPTNDSTVKDPDKTRTFYEKLSDIIEKLIETHVSSLEETSMLRQKCVTKINSSTSSSGITQKVTSTKTEKSLLNSAVYKPSHYEHLL